MAAATSAGEQCPPLQNAAYRYLQLLQRRLHALNGLLFPHHRGQVGAAAGTIAKTMSAYDMAVSDDIYGHVQAIKKALGMSQV